MAAVARRASLGQAAAVALSAVSDAAAVLAAVGDRHAEFAWPARHVKAWAAARGLDSAPFGGLPGLAWALLAARTVRSSRGDLLAEFFGGWAAWETVVAGGDPLPAVAPHRRHAAWAVITVPDGEVGRVRGRMRALLTELEAAGVADVHAWPKPFAESPVRYAVGLGRTPPTAAELAGLAEPWCVPGVTVAWTDCGGVPTLPA